MKVLPLVYLGCALGDQSRRLQTDEQESLLQGPMTPAKAYAAAMNKLRSDRDMFAKERVDYEQRAIEERREANLH